MAPSAAGASSSLKREGSPSLSGSPANDSKKKQKKRDTRRKVSLACVYCRRSHMTCDESRPCKRCIKREIGHLCHDEPPTKSHPHGPVASTSAKKGKRKDTLNLSEAEESTAGSTHSFGGGRRSPGLSEDPSLGQSPSAPVVTRDSVESSKQDRDSAVPLPPPPLAEPSLSLRGYLGPAATSPYPAVSNNGSLFTHSAGLSSSQLPQSSPQQQPSQQERQQQQQQILTQGFYRDPSAFNQTLQSQGLRTPTSQPLLSLGLPGIGAANAQSSNNMSWLLGGGPSPLPTPQLSTAGIGGAGWLGLGLGGGGHGYSEREGREPVSDAAGGLEYSILSEFLESLDGANMMSDGATAGEGQQDGEYGMTPAAMNQGVQTENEDKNETMRPPRPEGHSRSMSVSVPESPRISFDLPINPPPNASSSSSSSRPANGSAAPYPPGFSSKTERFFLTAADQIDGTRDERLGRVIQAKYDAGLLRPYNPLPGYARLQQWCQQHASPASRRRILKPLSVFRPAFRQAAQKLSNLDLIYEAEAAERLLLDYDRVFSTQGVPACLWRRAGEIYKGNKEFAELVGVPVESLREGKLCIYELMTEESAVNYWEKYGAVSFDPGQKAVLTSCVLRSYNSSLAHARDISAASAVEAQLPHSQVGSGGQTTPVKGSSGGSVGNGEALHGALGFASAAAAAAVARGGTVGEDAARDDGENGANGTAPAGPPEKNIQLARDASSSSSSSTSGAVGANGVAGKNAPTASTASTSAGTDDGGVVKIECCFSFTIRRDGVQIPNLIIGNFLPVRIQR